jgi:hypothetical protein
LTSYGAGQPRHHVHARARACVIPIGTSSYVCARGTWVTCVARAAAPRVSTQTAAVCQRRPPPPSSPLCLSAHTQAECLGPGAAAAAALAALAAAAPPAGYAGYAGYAGGGQLAPHRGSSLSPPALAPRPLSAAASSCCCSIWRRRARYAARQRAGRRALAPGGGSWCGATPAASSTGFSRAKSAGWASARVFILIISSRRRRPAAQRCVSVSGLWATVPGTGQEEGMLAVVTAPS